jgi:hypothetical protein
MKHPLQQKETDQIYMTQMMQQHVKLMQSQLQSSFDMIAKKMQEMEGRISRAD